MICILLFIYSFIFFSVSFPPFYYKSTWSSRSISQFKDKQIIYTLVDILCSDFNGSSTHTILLAFLCICPEYTERRSLRVSQRDGERLYALNGKYVRLLSSYPAYDDDDDDWTQINVDVRQLPFNVGLIKWFDRQMQCSQYLKKRAYYKYVNSYRRRKASCMQKCSVAVATADCRCVANYKFI